MGGSHDRLTDSGDWRERIVPTGHRHAEDTRIGLSFLVSVASLPSPPAGALYAIGGAICGEDFPATGRTLKSLASVISIGAGLQLSCATASMSRARYRVARCRPAWYRGGIRLPAIQDVDFKPRDGVVAWLAAEATTVRGTLTSLARIVFADEDKVDCIGARCCAKSTRVRRSSAAVTSGIPEVLICQARASLAGLQPIIA
jgi:hypothetical protein